MDLFEDDREPRASSSKAEFGVNTIFASAYDARKRAEELSNCVRFAITHHFPTDFIFYTVSEREIRGRLRLRRLGVD